MVVELSCFYLVPCRRAVFHPALPTHPPRISLSYFRPSLFYPQRRLYAGSFSVRVVHYRLVRVSFASFIFFPRLPFSVHSFFPSTFYLRLVPLYILSVSSFAVPFLSAFLFPFLVFPPTVPPVSESHIYTRSVVACFNTCFAQKFTL